MNMHTWLVFDQGSKGTSSAISTFSCATSQSLGGFSAQSSMSMNLGAKIEGVIKEAMVPAVQAYLEKIQAITAEVRVSMPIDIAKVYVIGDAMLREVRCLRRACQHAYMFAA